MLAAREFAADRTWLAPLRSGAGLDEVLAVVDDPARDCRSSATHLTCRTARNHLQVWQIRR